LDTNNQDKRVFLTLSHVTNFTNMEPKLRPDFDRLEYHLFEKKKNSCFCLNTIESNGLWGDSEQGFSIFYAKLEWRTMKRRGKWPWFDACNYYRVWTGWWRWLAILWEYIGETWIISSNRDWNLHENWTMSKKEPNVCFFSKTKKAFECYPLLPLPP